MVSDAHYLTKGTGITLADYDVAAPLARAVLLVFYRLLSLHAILDSQEVCRCS